MIPVTIDTPTSFLLELSFCLPVSHWISASENLTSVLASGVNLVSNWLGKGKVFKYWIMRYENSWVVFPYS